MKRWTLRLALLSASLLASCDAFFETNPFKDAGLGQLKVPSASSLSSASLSELESYAESSAFFEELKDNADKQDAVVANLEDQYATSSDPATVQGAAALCAEVLLKTSGAFDLVNGVFAAADEIAGIDFDAMSSTDITTFVEAALPAEILEDEASFKEAILALLRADEAYDALGTSIGADGLSGVDPTLSVQGAIVAALVDGVPGASDTAKADALWAALQGTALPSYTAPDFGSSTPLGAIVDAAGIDLGEYGV